MAFVAILGAGDVGGALAFTLARRDCVGEIRLIDANASLAAGKALDIRQAAATEGFGTRLAGFGDLREAVGAAATVIADEAGAATAPPDAPLAVLRELASLDSATTFVCALPSHHSLVERAAVELRIPRMRLLGSAPGALVSAVRAIVAAALDVSPSDVSLAVLGAPPDSFVIPWSDASVGGFRLDEIASPATLAGIRRRVPRLWPPGPYALASAAARVCEGLVAGSHRQHVCFVTLEGEFGVRGRAAALPVEIGARHRIILPPLTLHERVVLESALR
jgi:malate/lactate dehydrogenase